MKIKTAELTGRALDWAVESLEIAKLRESGEHVKQWWVDQKQSDPSPYSTDWLRAGEIIEREKIRIEPTWDGEVAGWEAKSLTKFEHYFALEEGPTPLIAAMRCYVASKLGDEVDIPEELV